MSEIIGEVELGDRFPNVQDNPFVLAALWDAAVAAQPDLFVLHVMRHSQCVANIYRGQIDAWREFNERAS
jgi:hypothetical protein